MGSSRIEALAARVTACAILGALAFQHTPDFLASARAEARPGLAPILLPGDDDTEVMPMDGGGPPRI